VEMAITWDVLGSCALLVLVYMTAWFLASLAFRRADIADIAWGLGFVAIAGWLLVRPDAPGTLRQYAVAALVAVWGLRLAWHVGRRNLRPGHGEDPRYAAWRREWGRLFTVRSYLQVFLLQGLFMLLISMPVLVSGSAQGGDVGLFDALGVGIWLLGFTFEALGDAQLARFLKEPSNAGHIMDRGLWAWTRHPNYFGEATMWWGLAVVCLSVKGGWIAFVGPVTITWLLLKVSGVPMVEAPRAGQPEWEDYKARTSAFLPLPPRRP
jgi:steroid 5-alpha reductase family enzyme